MIADICHEPDIRPARTKPFLWRAHGGAKLPPHQMRTSHLFNTVRMIWNNTVPERKVGFGSKLYCFGPSYTEEYLREAYLVLRAEIWTRKVTLEQARDLQRMGEQLPDKLTIVRPAPPAFYDYEPDRLTRAFWMGDDY